MDAKSCAAHTKTRKRAARKPVADIPMSVFERLVDAMHKKDAEGQMRAVAARYQEKKYGPRLNEAVEILLGVRSYIGGDRVGVNGKRHR